MFRLAQLACMLAFVLSACADSPAESPTPSPTTTTPAGADDRGPLGKADDNGSCGNASRDTCGTQSPDGCWCDAECSSFGDCCSDYAEVCLGPSTTATGPSSSGASDGSSGDAPPPPTCSKNVVLMGYWPPTNEMLRPWSDDPLQNPDGWQGANWRGLGYDVYAFFPEFPPDGDPSNDPIGADGAVGSPDFELRVDYQATSADFWRIVDELDPILLVTTSRGGGIGWEIEAIEGGHGQDGERDPARDWMTDAHGDVVLPTEATIDPRSWAVISEFRLGTTVPSALPMQAIAEATTALGIASVQIDETGTSGNFLSGFLGLHGIAYHRTHPHNLAAGHIHVAIGMSTATARTLMEATLQTLLKAHPAASATCP